MDIQNHPAAQLDLVEKEHSSRAREAPGQRLRSGPITEFSLQGVAQTRRTSLGLPGKLPLEMWKRIGEHIHLIAESSAWWIGDWLLFGRSKYPDRYRRAIEETSLDYQTLRNYAWVAGRFAVSRRRDRLSFQHHVEVAALAEDQQDVWLDRAERFGWSRNALRSKLRAALKSEREASKAASRATVQLTVSREREELWQAAAERAGLDVLHWIATVLDRVARTEADFNALPAGTTQ